MHSKWTAVEDRELRLLVQRHGEHNWPEVAAGFEARTPDQCLSRWRATGPNVRSGKWDRGEDLVRSPAVCVSALRMLRGLYASSV